LSQHSKDVFFGLGKAKEPVRASIRWPSGFVQELKALPINHRIWIEEGSERFRMEPFAGATPKEKTAPASSNDAEILPEKVETWLAAPISAPDFALADLSGTVQSLSAFLGKAILLNFSTTHAAESREEMKDLHRFSGGWKSNGLQLISVNTDGDLGGVRSIAQGGGMKFPILQATDDVIAIYNILYRQLFDRHRDLVLPTSFLIDKTGSIVKVYRGSVSAKQIEDDFLRLPTTQAERLARALPFPSTLHALDVGRNYLSLGGLFFQQGYLDQAETSFQQAMRDDPTSAEAAYGIGSVYLNQNKNTAAREIFERAASLQANYPDTLPDTWNNLGVIATREGRIDDSVRCFERALELSPRHVLSLNNLGNAYRVQKRWNEASTVLERALEISPRDAEANYGLGMVFAQTGDNANAHAHLERALRSRPDYPEALNNLGVLYLVMQRRDEAVASFENCIRVAPGFDQAYLNLARVYALGGSRDQARHILQELLKQHPNHEQAIALLNQLEQ
jgi:tetratricopeptide (TPR) repeat protein/peroxiredoxin